MEIYIYKVWWWDSRRKFQNPPKKNIMGRKLPSKQKILHFETVINLCKCFCEYCDIPMWLIDMFWEFFIAKNHWNSQFFLATEWQILQYFFTEIDWQVLCFFRDQLANSDVILFRIFGKLWNIDYQFGNSNIKKYNRKKIMYIYICIVREFVQLFAKNINFIKYFQKKIGILWKLHQRITERMWISLNYRKSKFHKIIGRLNFKDKFKVSRDKKVTYAMEMFLLVSKSVIVLK